RRLQAPRHLDHTLHRLLAGGAGRHPDRAGAGLPARHDRHARLEALVSAPVLETRRLAKSFGGVQAVAGVDLAMPRGEIGAAVAHLDQVGLAAQAGRVAGVLAYGDLKKLDLAVALANEPELLLLDEPTAGMAPAERGALMALTERIARARGLTVLFTEHDMDVVFSVADRIMVLHQGRVIAEGRPDAVRADSQVQKGYLGEAE